MSNRITNNDLAHLRDRINKATGSPMEEWSTNGDGKTKANVGNYYISAYGGVKLERIENTDGGSREVSTQGFSTKRELYDWMSAFLAGCVAQEAKYLRARAEFGK